MSTVVRPWGESDRETLRALLAHPSIAPQFDKFQGDYGLEHKLADRKLERAGLRLAFVDGEPAGFGVVWLLPQPGGAWAMCRVGVAAPFRRRGLGLQIAEAVLAHVRSVVPRELPIDVAGAAWLPNEAAEALVARLGFRHERWFWLMERPRGGRRPPGWPAGIRTRTFDGSEAQLGDWNDAYNDSFAKHYRYIPSTMENVRHIVAAPGFRADGLLLAYRAGRCVGFCRNELHAARGELALLGTTHDARGIGLGRALMRWGIAWLEDNTPLPVTLIVDGDNEGALALYRAEGFAVATTRRIWGRTLAGDA